MGRDRRPGIVICQLIVSMISVFQVILHDIPDIPRDHGSLRKAVANSLMTLPQTPEWIENFFENSKKNFLKFMARHRRLGTWTDNLGIMCQATALYLGNSHREHPLGSSLIYFQGGISTLLARPTWVRNSHLPNSRLGTRRISCLRSTSDIIK